MKRAEGDACIDVVSVIASLREQRKSGSGF